MRAHLIRSVLAAAVLTVLAAAPAIAQPLVRGRVIDATGKPVADAVVTFVAQFVSLSRNAKTDGKGEFLMVGLPSGQSAITATKEGVGTDKITSNVTQGQNAPLSLTLRPSTTPATSESLCTGTKATIRFPR